MINLAYRKIWISNQLEVVFMDILPERAEQGAQHISQGAVENQRVESSQTPRPQEAENSQTQRPRISLGPYGPQEHHGELTVQEARKNVIHLAWPAVFEQLLIQLFSMADMMMVGGVGPAAIAAIGLTNQPVFLALAAFQALNVGTTAVVARFIGAGDINEANAAARQSLLLVGVLGVLMTIGIYLTARPILVFMGAGPDAIDYGVTYLRVIALSFIPQTIGMAVTAILRGAGDTRTPMRYNIIANVVNVVGNLLLINGYLGFPRWGVFGAAVATAIGRVAGMFMALYAVSNGRSSVHVSFRDKFTPDFDLVRRIVKIGSPAMFEQVIMRIGMITYTKVVAGLGTIIYAAHQIGINIVGLSFTPGMGFGAAASSLVGRSLGAKRPDWAELYGWQTRRVGMYVAAFMGVVFFFGGEFLASLYTSDPVVIQNAALTLRIIAFVQTFQSSQFILAGALRGAGDTRWPLISTLVGVVGIRALLSILFVKSFEWGLVGAWVAMALDQLTRSGFIYFRYKSGHWKQIKV